MDCLTIFGAGVSFVRGEPLWGGPLVAGGVIWLIYALRHDFAPKAYRFWIVLFSTIVASVIVAYDIYQRDGIVSTPATVSQFTKFSEPYAPKIVSGKTFRNEKVPLDGIEYEHCIFNNVTLVYNGTTPIRFAFNTVNGPIEFASDNASVTAAFVLLYSLGFTKDVAVHDMPPSAHIELPARNN